MIDLLLATSGIATPPVTVWTKLSATDAPVGITEQAVSTYKNDIYFVGGYDNVAAKEIASLYKFTPSTNTFTKLADMPVAMRLHRCVMGAGKLYVWGGYDGTSYTSRFYIYTISSNTWAAGTMPAAANRPGCAQAMMVNIGLDVYIMGGGNGDAPSAGTTNAVKYNPVANTWTALPAMPGMVINGSACVQDDKIFVAYGVNTNGTVTNKSITCYDPITNAWTTKVADITTDYGARSGAKATLFGDEIFYWGGWSDSLKMSKYSPRTNTFTDNVGTIPAQANFYSYGFKAKEKFYTIGSLTGTEFWVYDPYVGKPKPTLVVIPFQEYMTASEFTTAGGLSTNGTATYEGMNWILMRFDNETWLLPQKPLRTNCPLDSSYAYSPSGTGKMIQGVSMTWYGPANTNTGATEPWTKLFARVSKSYTLNPIPKLALWDNATLGFGAGANASYEWTRLANGAYDTWARGGTDPGAQGATLNSSSGRANIRPLIKITSTNFPW